MDDRFAEVAKYYRRVTGALAKHGIGHRFLHRVLTRDPFARRECLRDERALITLLAELCDAELAAPLQPEVLVSELVLEIADPDGITQGSKRTCAAAAVQILLASKYPAEYVRLVHGLASPGGEVRMAIGTVLKREPGTEQRDDSERRTPSRLIQAALMEYASHHVDYSNELDAHHHPDGSHAHVGLYSHQQQHLLDAVTGHDFEPVRKSTVGTTALFAAITRALRAGYLVPCGGKFGGGAHAVVLHGIAGVRVGFYDPWGERVGMARTEFERRVQDAMVPIELMPAPNPNKNQK